MFSNLAPHTSYYQALKLQIVSVLPMQHNTVHFFIGLLIVLFALAAWKFGKLRRPLIVAAWGSLAAGVLMEVLDLRDDLAWLGYWRWDASLADVLRTVAVPVVVLVLWSGRGMLKR